MLRVQGMSLMFFSSAASIDDFRNVRALCFGLEMFSLNVLISQSVMWRFYGAYLDYIAVLVVNYGISNTTVLEIP